MGFYVKLLKKSISKEKKSIFQYALFLLRLLLLIFFIYCFPTYYLCVLFVYRLFLSNLLVIDNNLYFSKNDMYLFDFRGKKQLRLLIFQRLFLNNFIFRMFYIIGIVSTLIYLREFLIIILLLVVEMVFFNLEFRLFKLSHLIQEQHLNLKIIGEVSVLMLFSISLVVFKDISVFLSQHVIEFSFIFLFFYFISLNLILLVLKKKKQSENRLLKSLLYRKIDIFTYKELRLFGRFIFSNIFILITSLAFFFIDKNEVSSYAMLFIIVSSVIFIHKKKGAVTNIKHDSYFLNNRLFFKKDNFRIVRKKFESYLVISSIIKIPLIIAVFFILSKISIIGLFNLILLTLLLIINEFNSFYVVGKFNFILHFTFRYILSILSILYTYLSKDILAIILVGGFLVREFYYLKINFLKSSRVFQLREIDGWSKVQDKA